MSAPSEDGTEPPELGAVEPDLAGGGLRAATIRGTAWTAGSRVSQQVIQLAITIVLARLLVPREFGLVGMIAVFTGFAVLFVDSGFGAAVVQRKDLTAAHLSTAFWLNLGAGVGIAALTAAVAPVVAWFFGQPRLNAIMPVAALNFVLLGLVVVQLALLERRMMFRRIAFVENASLVASGGMAIACAVGGLGVWSLVIFALASNGVEAVVLWALSDWRPAWTFDRRAFRELWGFGGSLLGSNAVNYWTRNADNLLIGRFVGPVALGLYTRAYSLALLQLLQVSYVVGRTLLPALSRLQESVGRVRRAYLRAVGVVAFVTFPIALGLFVSARPFILTLLGPKWSGVIPLIRILAVGAVFQSIVTTTGSIFQSQGRTDWALRWQLFAGPTAIAFFAVGVHWGAKGVAVAVSARTLLLLYPVFAIPGRLIGMRFLDVVLTVWRVLVLALIATAAAWAVGRGLSGEPPVVQLVAEIAVFGLIYIVSAHLVKLEPYRELRSELTRRGDSQAAASPIFVREAQ